MKIKGILFLVFVNLVLINQLLAQQWISKKYNYDSSLNVKYGTAINFMGNTDTLTMDIYLPKCIDPNNEKRKPLMLWIHGGAFLAGTKNDVNINYLVKQFAKRGYVTATINYRLGFVGDTLAWTCNYPNYPCVFGQDKQEWERSYFRAVQDAKGALRYLINRNNQFKIDTNNVFVCGESAGAFCALGAALLDTITEKPAGASALNALKKPNANTNSCLYYQGKALSTPILRPDLGNINGNIEPSNIKFTIKGVGNIYGAMLSNLLKLKSYKNIKPAIYSFHQPCDIVVPFDSNNVYWGLSWCMTNGYGCYAIKNTPMIYGSNMISKWNTNNNHGYNIKNEFTTTTFPYNFLIGNGSCADQVNNPCHAYDNIQLRENNLASFFAPYVTTSPVCDTARFGTIKNHYLPLQVSVFPNPLQNKINIQFATQFDGIIILKNMMGNTIFLQTFKGNKLSINTSLIGNSAYLLEIKSTYGSSQKIKLIKTE